MSFGPQQEFPPTVGGLSAFLSACPSVSMAMAIGAELQKVAQAQELSQATQLNSDILGSIRTNLYSRGEARSSEDVFAMLASALSGAGGGGTEEQLQFVENLQRQLAAGEKLNFSRAYASATR